MKTAEMERSVGKKSFADTFGVEWDAALGSVLRNDAALAKLGVDGAALEALWRQGDTCKLAPAPTSAAGGPGATRRCTR